MKKIIYIGLFNIEQMNAAGKRVFANAKLIKESGRDIILVGVNPDSPYSSIRESEKTVDGIKTYSFPSFVSGKYRYCVNKVFKLTTAFLREENLSTIESIIYYGSPSLSLYIQKLISFAHKNNILVLADVVDWLNVNTGNYLFDSFKRLDMYLEKGLFNRKADGVLVISTYLKNYYQKTHSNILLLPPLTWNKPINNKRPNKIPSIVYAGYPFRKNNKPGSTGTMKDRLDLAIKYLYEVFLVGIEFNFDIYGISKQDYLLVFPFDENKLSEMDECVTFHGRVSMDLVNNALEKSDYTILIRDINRMTSAGFPTKISESISLGIPVITTRTSDIDLYTCQNSNVYFLEGIDDERVEQLKWILSLSTQERLTVIEKCKEHNPFYYKQYVDKFEDFYSQLIK